MPKVLVVANETVDPAELRNRILAGDERHDAELFIVSPAHEHELGDIDDPIVPARERLKRSIRRLREAGIDARGEVGDADPLMAISDELQRFDADEIVIVAHRGPSQVHAENGVLERAKQRFTQPITELVVDADASF